MEELGLAMSAGNLEMYAWATGSQCIPLRTNKNSLVKRIGAQAELFHTSIQITRLKYQRP
jgi:hypothetical protein